jgi:hypothetical protein
MMCGQFLRIFSAKDPKDAIEEAVIFIRQYYETFPRRILYGSAGASH